MPGISKPSYIEVGGQQVFCHPLQLDGVRFYGFVIRANMETLRALCDKYLNNPVKEHEEQASRAAGFLGRIRSLLAGWFGGASEPPLEYRPLVPRVLLGFADIRKASCAEPPDNQLGWMTEIDVAFWVPVVILRRAGPLLIPVRLAWFLPYVFVDNAWASASGREIYGFPKAIGSFQIPAAHQDPAVFTVDTFVLKQHLPTTQAQFTRLLEVRRVDHELVAGPERIWADFKESFLELSRAFFEGETVLHPDVAAPISVFNFLSHVDVPMVFRKQFRDVEDGRRACYQSIVEAPAQLLKLHSGGLLPGQYQITLNQYDSHPIIQELGLEGTQPQVLSAWYSEFDFVMARGREVWSAT